MRGSEDAQHIAAVFAAVGGNGSIKTAKRLSRTHLESRFISGFLRGRWDRNRTCNLRFWRSRRSVPDRPIQSQNAVFSGSVACVSSHTAQLRSIALMPLLLPRALLGSNQIAEPPLTHSRRA